MRIEQSFPRRREVSDQRETPTGKLSESFGHRVFDYLLAKVTLVLTNKYEISQ